MKKVLILVVIIFLAVFFYYKFMDKPDMIYEIVKSTEDETVKISKYSIFGTHLNIEGCINEQLINPKLIMKNDKEEIEINSIFTDNNCFKISENNNDSIYLDSLDTGIYVLLVKSEDKYYNLENITEYGNLIYYTITKNEENKKINIDFNNYNDKNYLVFTIKNDTLPEDVYDITIDPGHGGIDPGASTIIDNKVYNESDITLSISLKLKRELEKLGLKVKLTRDSDEALSNYGDNGRSVIANAVNSKYSISIHVNSFSGYLNYGGVEVYIPNNVNYDLAKLFADNISEIVSYSRKQTYKVSNGIYFSYFDEEDVRSSKEGAIEDGLEPYNIKVGAPYMFMIRELGGINTYAYVDGRNPKQGYNKFYNSNQTVEPYLIELGYINYKKDLENLNSRPEAFAKAISDALKQYLDIT